MRKEITGRLRHLISKPCCSGWHIAAPLLLYELRHIYLFQVGRELVHIIE